jgi:hypothetical protein
MGGNGNRDKHLKTHYQCGETAHLKDMDISVQNPSSTYVYGSSATFSEGIREGAAYLRVPVKIKAKDKVDLSNYDFDSEIVKKDKKCFPKELKLEKGEKYSGYLYVKWPEAENYGIVKKAPAKITYPYGNKTISWKFNYSKTMVNCNKFSDALKLLPGTKVQMRVRYFTMDGIGGKYLENNAKSGTASFTIRGTSGAWAEENVCAKASGETFKKLINKNRNSIVTIRGKLQNVTMDTGGGEVRVDTQIVLSDLSVVS